MVVTGDRPHHGFSKNAIQRLTASLGEAVLEYSDNVLRNIKSGRVQCDEIWCFCYAKDKNVPDSMRGNSGVGSMWTWTAMDDWPCKASATSSPGRKFDPCQSCMPPFACAIRIDSFDLPVAIVSELGTGKPTSARHYANIAQQKSFARRFLRDFTNRFERALVHGSSSVHSNLLTNVRLQILKQYIPIFHGANCRPD